MEKESKILITGGNGLVGKALINRLKIDGYNNILSPKSKELDLRNQKIVFDYFKNNAIEYVFHLAAKVGGIAANIKYPAEFLYDDLEMQNNVIEASRQYSIKKLLFIGSSCIYPKECPQPMKEEYLLSGKLEPTNEGYAIAKIAGLKLCEYYNKQYGTNFICLMPCNIYGPNDHFELERSHVVSALITKFHSAKEKNEQFVEVWGTGRVMREFLYVDDLVDAIIFFINKKDWDALSPFINIGSGKDVSIAELAVIIKNIVGYKGEIKFDITKPDGMIKKRLDIKKAKECGWSAKIGLVSGLEKTYNWYANQPKDEK